MFKGGEVTSGNNENTAATTNTEGTTVSVDNKGMENTEASTKSEISEGEKKTGSEVSNGDLESQKGEVAEMKSEVVEKENAAIEKHFQDFQETRWKDAPEKLELKKEIISKSMDMAHEHHVSAMEIAKLDDSLKNYSDHTDLRHSKQVVEKTLEQMDQYKQLVQEHPEKWKDTLSADCSENTLILAASLHDVGMAGNVVENENPLEAYEARVKVNDDVKDGTVGEQIRKSHSMESSMFVLSKRDEIETINDDIRANAKDGEDPDLINADEAAMIIALHSKSAKLGAEKIQAKDLSDHEQLMHYAQELKFTASQHGLEFKDDFLYTTDEQGERVPDKAALTRLSTEAAALRLGDSFRPSSDVQITQSGRAVFVDATKVADKTESLDEEMKGVEVGFFTEEGLEDKEMRLSLNSDKSETISKAYAVGEKNIADIKSGVVDSSGDLQTDIFLRDGNVCPRATAFVIHQRMGESESINSQKKGDMLYRIHSSETITVENRETIRRELENYQGIQPPEKKGEKPASNSLVEDCSDEDPNAIRIEFVD